MNARAPLPTASRSDLLQIVSIEPHYGSNYRAGYVGFTYNNNSFISEGIAYFTRWSNMHDIGVSHVLLVSGENECIEAHADGGVKRRDLARYFEDKHCQIFFRKPAGITPDLASRLIDAAEAQLGCAYDLDLITAQLMSNSLVGAALRRLLGRGLEEKLCRLKDHPDRWICSELVAHCLDAQPEYHDRGVLARSDATIDPQELFEDDSIFENWHQQQPAA